MSVLPSMRPLPSPPAMLLGLLAFMLPGCCGPKSLMGGVQADVSILLDRFREPAKFALPDTNKWWFLLPSDNRASSNGPASVMLCGSDHNPLGAEELGGGFGGIVIWDYDGRRVPSSSELRYTSAPISLGATFGLGKSLLETSGFISSIQFRELVDGRFVVGATTRESLERALERRGEVPFLECHSLRDLPGDALEIVVRYSKARIQSGLAYAASPRRLMFFESSLAERLDGVEPETMFFGEDGVQGRRSPGGWWDYCIPTSADADYVLSVAVLHVVRIWRIDGLYRKRKAA